MALNAAAAAANAAANAAARTSSSLTWEKKTHVRNNARVEYEAKLLNVGLSV